MAALIFHLCSQFMMIMQTAEAAISIQTQQEERAKAIGRLSASFVIGKLTGRFVGWYTLKKFG